MIGRGVLKMMWRREELKVFNMLKPDTEGHATCFHLAKQARAEHAPTGRVGRSNRGERRIDKDTCWWLIG
ncbi:hypothetical protein L195_g051292 [Trifolium pratense]|uniref:Uncharacterized protein n=1 Tax=Trifolium pratense TaxID=57577 RepID=A0A2K3JYU7_TRIPR|nr:hypothetical protein L195_g051292 [Trifolium pratense]